MTAYGAVNSLRNTIHYILNSSHFSLVEPSSHIIQLAYQKLQPLQKNLERLDGTRKSKSRKKVNGLDGRIKEWIWEFEDLLESLLYQQILSQFPADQVYDEMKKRVWEFESLPSKSRSLEDEDEDEVGDERNRFSIDLNCLKGDVPYFIERLKDMEEEYIYEVDNMPEDDEIESISSRSGTNSELIGLSDQFQQLKGKIMKTSGGYMALVGTAGVGKTALAQAVFEDPDIMSHFAHRAWITVGRRSQFDDVYRGIRAQINGIVYSKCLIVLDDLWEEYILDHALFMFDRSNHLLVTTRDGSIILSKSNTFSRTLVRFLKEEESKELLCQKVFGEKDCPFQLDKAATKIAKICEGLPLMIVTVADILSKAKNTDPKYWDDVAEMRNSVFPEPDAYNVIAKVLFPSYEYLPQNLKMPFLYIGVFPPAYDIPISKIINMLGADGWFYKINKKHFVEDFFWKCLVELSMNKNLVLFHKRSTHITSSKNGFYMHKTCRLHSSWRHVCREEARKNKFYDVLKKLVEGSEDGVKGQRCLCLENNLLFGIKGFCNSVRLNCASSARSLLFFGPYHQYPVRVGDNFKLLGKLDALNLRLYTFPTEILTLALLKYLALTCNGELPPTISKLFNLRVLIIHPHNNIIICGSPSYVPTQIWDMQELEHIEVLGKSLVAPNRSACLQKLSTLVGVNASIRTMFFLSEKARYLWKLGVQIELTPYDDHNDLLSCFRCISTLTSLRILKFSIMNPVIKYDYAFPSSLMLFPHGLKKLHLSGMGFSWDYMDVIGSFPLLEVLKLRAYAFRGSEWEAQEGSFWQLKFLLIEDSDLVQWKPRPASFPNLVHLSMKHCYKLQEIHWQSHLWNGMIELVNCNPVVLTSGEQLQPGPCRFINVTVTSSFDEKPITISFTRYGPGFEFD